MTKKTETQMVAEIIQHVTRARDKWFDEHDEEGINKKVYDHLNRHEKEVFLKLLGFDKSWGNKSFEIDHCNGRNKDTVAGDYIRANHLSAIYDWLDNQIGEITSFKLSQATINDIKQNITRTYRRNLEQKVLDVMEDRIVSEANRIVDEVMKKCIDPENQEDTIKFAFELIGGVENPK